MVLVIDAICQGVQCTNLTYLPKDYESAFEELTSLVAAGWTLKRAVLIDGNSRIELPVSVFDGESFRNPMQRLQEQWQQLLQDWPKPDLTPNAHRLKDWHCELIIYYQQQLNLLKVMIVYLEGALDKVGTKPKSDANFRLGKQYDSLLLSQKRLLVQTEAHYQRALTRLNQL